MREAEAAKKKRRRKRERMKKKKKKKKKRNQTSSDKYSICFLYIRFGPRNIESMQEE